MHEGCYDAAKAYRTPFVSGKDSLNNQFRTKDGSLIEIPPTLLITGVGIVPDVNKCVTMDAKRAGNRISVITGNDGPTVAREVAALIESGKIHSAHDASEGGILVALSEMLIASEVDSLGFAFEAPISPEELFSESSATYLVEHSIDIIANPIGTLNADSSLVIASDVTIPVSELRDAFLGTLDW